MAGVDVVIVVIVVTSFVTVSSGARNAQHFTRAKCSSHPEANHKRKNDKMLKPWKLWISFFRHIQQNSNYLDWSNPIDIGKRPASTGVEFRRRWWKTFLKNPKGRNEILITCNELIHFLFHFHFHFHFHFCSYLKVTLRCEASRRNIFVGMTFFFFFALGQRRFAVVGSIFGHDLTLPLPLPLPHCMFFAKKRKRNKKRKTSLLLTFLNERRWRKQRIIKRRLSKLKSLIELRVFIILKD